MSRRHLAHDDTAAPAPTTTRSRDALLSSVGARAARFDGDPERRSNREALFALLNTQSLYDEGGSVVSPFDPDKVKVLKGGIRPTPW